MALPKLGGTLQQLAVAAAACGPRLRHLVLENVRELPPEVAALPLDTLVWMGQGRHSWPAGLAGVQLPSAGPYLTSLRRLALTSEVAANSTTALSAMSQLEALAILGREPYEREWPAPVPKRIASETRVLEWAAAQQPASLRRLGVSFDPWQFDRTSWSWRLYARPVLAGAAKLPLPPSLQVELSAKLLCELRDT